MRVLLNIDLLRRIPILVVVMMMITIVLMFLFLMILLLVVLVLLRGMALGMSMLVVMVKVPTMGYHSRLLVPSNMCADKWLLLLMIFWHVLGCMLLVLLGMRL
jgi:hypothetical protein